MPSQTLAEAKKFINDDIVAGVVQDIISINPFFQFLPFNGYEGQAILVNREEALGDANFYAIDATITSKNPAQFTQVPFTATKIIGDVELDGLVQAQSQSAGVDQLAIEISSKSKSIGRLFQRKRSQGKVMKILDKNQSKSRMAKASFTLNILKFNEVQEKLIR